MSAAVEAHRIAKLARELGIPVDYAEKRGLAPQPEAADLVVIGLNPEGGEVRLSQAAAAAWERMRAAAAKANIELLPLSGFRSVARQVEIIRRKLDSGQQIKDILRLVAAPGYSEHHTGRAIDIGTPGEPPLEDTFAVTAAFAWLKAEAPKFGFHLSFPQDNPHHIAFEPWHWCYLK